jgi:phage baseplate assembly protein W
MSDDPIHLAFPYRLVDGVETHAGMADYVEELIELLLFTAKGERVDRPDFGCGIEQLLFQPIDSPLVPATLFTVKSELQRYLGSQASVEDVTVHATGPELDISVTYRLAKQPGQRIARYQNAGRA